MTFTYQRAYRGPVRAVLLDWAGTTLDHGCLAPAVVFVEVYRKHGVPITMEQARAPMGAAKRRHIQQIGEIDAVAQRWREVHGQPMSEKDVEAMFADFVPLQLACLADYADLIPGTLESVAKLRARGIRIGSTTGYTREMMDLLREEARRRGYEPDTTACASDVPEARPAPFMCFKNAIELGVWPVEAYVKVDDTIPGVEEGLNAGMWTVGLAMTGNEVGLTLDQLTALDPAARAAKRSRAYQRLSQAGAHFVVDSIADVPACIDAVEERLRRGERP